MKKLWLLFGALIWPHVAAAAAEPPFAPLSNIPDYVATIFVKLYHGPTYREFRSHHGGWIRLEEFNENTHRSTSFFGPDQLFVTFAHNPSPPREYHDWLHILRGPAMAHLVRWGSSPFKTDERQTLLGESCEIWNLSSKRWLSPNARHLSCVTPDGIELWSRVEGNTSPTTSFEATAISRQPVEPGWVRPPRERLDLKSWLTAPDGADRPAAAPGDVTVVMRNEAKAVIGPHIQTRTVRRHYPWKRLA